MPRKAPKKTPKKVSATKKLSTSDRVVFHQGNRANIQKKRRALILQALNNESYQARTLSGIAKETSLPKQSVINTLKGDATLKQLVKVYPRLAKNGSLLITTKDNFKKSAPLSDKFIDLFASRRITLKDAK